MLAFSEMKRRRSPPPPPQQTPSNEISTACHLHLGSMQQVLLDGLFQVGLFVTQNYFCQNSVVNNVIFILFKGKCHTLANDSKRGEISIQNPPCLRKMFYFLATFVRLKFLHLCRNQRNCIGTNLSLQKAHLKTS